MNTRWIIPLALALGLAGCENQKWNWPSSSPPPPPESQDTRLQALETEVRTLKARNEEVSLRSTLLAEEVRKLKGDSDQLVKQLAAVGDAPRQRDQYKQLVGMQREEIDRLSRRVAELEGRGGPPTTAPAPPTTAPAGPTGPPGPATAPARPGPPPRPTPPAPVLPATPPRFGPRAVNVGVPIPPASAPAGATATTAPAGWVVEEK